MGHFGIYTFFVRTPSKVQKYLQLNLLIEQ